MTPDTRRELNRWFEDQRNKLIRGIVVGLIITTISVVGLTALFIYIVG